MSPKLNLWAKLSDKLQVVLPNHEKFDPAQFFALGLLEPAEWPPLLLSAHWIWKGGKSGEHPIMRIGKDIATVRRVLYCLTCMDPEPRGVVFFKVQCGNMSCVNPTHFVPIIKKGQRPQAMPHVPVNFNIAVDEVQELADELLEQWGMKEFADFADVMSRPIICDYPEDKVREALGRAGLKVE